MSLASLLPQNLLRFYIGNIQPILYKHLKYASKFVPRILPNRKRSSQACRPRASRIIRIWLRWIPWKQVLLEWRKIEFDGAKYPTVTTYQWYDKHELPFSRDHIPIPLWYSTIYELLRSINRETRENIGATTNCSIGWMGQRSTPRWTIFHCSSVERRVLRLNELRQSSADENAENKVNHSGANCAPWTGPRDIAIPWTLCPVSGGSLG